MCPSTVAYPISRRIFELVCGLTTAEARSAVFLVTRSTVVESSFSLTETWFDDIHTRRSGAGSLPQPSASLRSIAFSYPSTQGLLAEECGFIAAGYGLCRSRP